MNSDIHLCCHNDSSKIILLDRDGVINKEVSAPRTIDPNHLESTDNAPNSIDWSQTG